MNKLEGRLLPGAGAVKKLPVAEVAETLGERAGVRSK